jgi:thiol-disulfide isomerase/thioredoxin
MSSRIRTMAAVVALSLTVALAVGTACDESGGNPGGNCSQLLCEGGSVLCCDPALPGTWDPAGMSCGCPPPDTDADADGDGDVAADADADADADVDSDSSDPCYAYPCAPYGTALGDVFSDLDFTPANEAAVTMAGDDGSFDFHDLYATTPTHGGTNTAMMVFVSAGWCSVCAQEAPKLEALYQELKDQGVLLLGILTDGNTPGVNATATEGAAYARRYGWTFPTVVGQVDTNVWPPADVASGSIGVPLHFFMDLREMRLYGRFAGGTEMKMPRYILTEIATEPHWSAPGERDFNFDCAPGTGTENEPNDQASNAVNGTSLPFEMSGVSCPPTVGDGLLLDADMVNLGTLTAGTVIDVGVAAGADAPTYPFMQLVPATSSMGYPTMGPSFMGAASVGRQWVILAAGQYFLAVVDGRQMSSFYYGTATPPVDDQCCEGGPEYTYDLSIDRFTLAVTDGAVAVGTPASGAFSSGDLDVRSLDVTAGTSYTVRMNATDTAALDSYLVVYNPDTSTVLGSNDDDPAGPSGNLNSVVTFTASAAGTVYVVAGYYAASFRAGGPAYTITVN